MRQTASANTNGLIQVFVLDVYLRSSKKKFNRNMIPHLNDKKHFSNSFKIPEYKTPAASYDKCVFKSLRAAQNHVT